MTDELQLLLDSQPLQALLQHYASGGEPDREAWLDRVMEWQGVRGEGLVRFHGLLIAFGWIELTQGGGIRRDERPAVITQQQKACVRRVHPGPEPFVVGAKLGEALELETAERVGTATHRRTHRRERILPLRSTHGSFAGVERAA